MRRNSASQCALSIDTYARTEGTSWEVTRFPRNLPKTRPDFKISGGIFDPVLDEKARLTQLSEALTLEALPKNTDVSAFSLQDLSKSPHSPRRIDWPRGKEESKKIFDEMVKAVFRITYGKTYKLKDIYCPALRASFPVGDFFGDDGNELTCALKEKANVGELKEYASRPSRRANATVWWKYYKEQPNAVAAKRGKINRKGSIRHYVEE